MFVREKNTNSRFVLCFIVIISTGSFFGCTTAQSERENVFRNNPSVSGKNLVKQDHKFYRPTLLSEQKSQQKSPPAGKGGQVALQKDTPINFTELKITDSQLARFAFVSQATQWRQSLNGTWKFKYIPLSQSEESNHFFKASFDITGWQDIVVPGNWELQGFGTPGFKEVQAGTGLYRTVFNVPSEWSGRNVFIVLDGTFNAYQLWVNETQAGSWDSPYNRAMFNLTKYLKAGPNLLAIKVFTQVKGLNPDLYKDWTLSGIFRDVYLYSVPEVYSKDLTVKTKLESPEQAQLELAIELASTLNNINWRHVKVNGTLLDPHGQLVQKFDLAGRIESVKLTRIDPVEGEPLPGPGGSVTGEQAGQDPVGGSGPVGGNSEAMAGETVGGGIVAGGEIADSTLDSLQSDNNLSIGLTDQIVDLAQNMPSGLKAGRLTGLLPVKTPLLWTAETPLLYTLTLSITYNDKLMQEISDKIGIRQVSVDGGILKLNGQPLKLRGINRVELYPDTGKALTEKQLLEDLRLLKAANINFIRTTYAPPHPRFLELADEWGFYIMSDMPIGPGLGLENDPADKAFSEVLLRRIKTAYLRDKNRASLLFYSLGHEQELNPLTIEAGKHLKSLDDSRLICYPQSDAYFTAHVAELPAFVDLLAPHFPRAGTIKEHLKQGWNKPLIYTAYADALGLAGDRMSSLWELMYQNASIAGGAIWQFADLGIIRKSAQKVDTALETQTVWLDPDTYYDNHGLQGADGIVYADRTPQVDYWQCRSVYAPIRIVEDKLKVKKGMQELIFTIENRYDFLDLSTQSLVWEFFEDRVSLQKGTLTLACPPHQSIQVKTTLQIPGDPAIQFYWLKVVVTDAQGQPNHEQIIRLLPENGKMLVTQRLLKKLTPGKISLVQNPNAMTTVNMEFNGGYRLYFANNTGTIKFATKSGIPLINEGPYVRVGRKLTMADKTAISQNKLAIWQPHLLKEPFIVLAKEMTQDKASVRIRADYWYERPDAHEQSLEGGVRFITSPAGSLEVTYNYKTNKATDTFLEAGLSFILPESLTEFYWIGRGPYPAYPGKEALASFGFYHLNSNDLYFQGNHSLLLLAVLSDGQGNGFALVSENAFFLSVEKTEAGLVLSYNSHLSGRGNNEQEPETEVKAAQAGWISGAFKLIPLNSKAWSLCLTDLFGEKDSKVAPFQPFYHSYDQ